MGRKGKTLWTENGNGEKLMCYEADSEFDEAAHVAAVIGQNVKKGAKLKNCVIMQDTVVGENTRLDYVVADKNVVFENDRTLMGYQTYPVYVSKGSKV